MDLVILLVLLSAIAFGAKDVFAKKVLNSKKIKPIYLILVGTLLALFLITTFMFPSINFGIIQDIWWLFILKQTVFVTVLLYFYLLQKYEISLVAPLLNLSPLVLLFLNMFTLKEQISTWQVIGICIIVISAYMLERHHRPKRKPIHKHIHHRFFKDHEFAILAISLLIVVSCTAIIDKTIFQYTDVPTNIFYTNLFTFILIAIYFTFKHSWKAFFAETKKEPKILVAASIDFISYALVLAALSFPSGLATLLIPLRRTATIFSVLFGGILFHEKHILQKIILICFMIGGSLLLIL